MALTILLATVRLGAQHTEAASQETHPWISYRGSVEWIGAIRWLDPSDTPLNPGNRRFRLPQLSLQGEVRPNLRVELGTRLTAVVRPRALLTSHSSWAAGVPRSDERDASANWTELYLNWRPTDVVQVTYGLQNFQWGPAELLAPSNRIFHETGAFRDQLYYVRGRHLLRVNLSAGKQWSAIALAELTDNDEDPFVAGEPFRRQGQIKLEYSAASGRGYVGATAGARENSRPWFGEYASLELTEGFSAYVDAAHQKGSRAWYAVSRIPNFPLFVQRDVESDRWRTLAVAGLRYTFVQGTDARLEYLHQDAGYRKDDFALAAQAAAAATSREALAPYLSPGFEFIGRRMALVSVRVPDLPPAKRVMVQTRYLHSFTDGSGVAFVTGSLDASDAVVLFASGSVIQGEDTAEFSRFARASAVIGAVWTW